MSYESTFYFVAMVDNKKRPETAKYRGFFGLVETVIEMGRFSSSPKDSYDSPVLVDKGHEINTDLYLYNSHQTDPYSPTTEDAYGAELVYYEMEDFKDWLLDTIKRHPFHITFHKTQLLLTIVNTYIATGRKEVKVIHYGH